MFINRDRTDEYRRELQRHEDTELTERHCISIAIILGAFPAAEAPPVIGGFYVLAALGWLIYLFRRTEL